jgi:hypothetical protein
MENSIVGHIEIIYNDDSKYAIDNDTESVYDEILEADPDFFNTRFITKEKEVREFNTIICIMKNPTEIICIQSSSNNISREDNVSTKSYHNSSESEYATIITNLCVKHNVLISVETHLIVCDLVLNLFTGDFKSDKYYNKWKNKNGRQYLRVNFNYFLFSIYHIYL